MPTLLTPAALARDLAIRDLTDPAAGPHALQLLVDDIVGALRARWGCDVDVVRGHPVVPVEDNYDRLGYPADAAARDTLHTRYVSDTCMLRSHTSAGIPAALRRLRGAPPRDLLIACPGIVYRRDRIDRLHTGTPHQLDLWRVRSGRPLGDADLDDMIDVVISTALPGFAYRSVPAQHPYTRRGRQVDVLVGAGPGQGEPGPEPSGYVEVGECGLAAPSVLAGAGLHLGAASGLAMGLGLDRLLMLRKGVPDIRLLRSDDPRVAVQMLDLDRWRAVSSQPPIRRDVSIAVDAAASAEVLGDRVRDALGERARAVETVEILTETDGRDLPAAAVERLGLGPGQKNVLLRLVLRDVDRTLTDAEANELRDAVFDALHEGAVTLAASRSCGEGC